jgi:hypothetical protein
MTAGDRLAWLDAYGVHVTLSDDGCRLDVSGPAAILSAALPALRCHRAELLGYLWSVRKSAGKADHESVVRTQTVAAAGVSDGMCPKCARP